MIGIVFTNWHYSIPSILQTMKRKELKIFQENGNQKKVCTYAKRHKNTS